MTSLYRRLFTYRERPDRSPVEDFLTEGLADLLDRMPVEAGRDLVARMLRGGADVERELGQIWTLGSSARWSTQRAIAGGRLDLLLEIDGRAAVVVESKVSAGFQEHADHVTGHSRHQLETYGEWLGNLADHRWGGALILLTHWTSPPPDFLQVSGSYGCRHRGVTRWSELSRWLSVLIRLPEHADAGWALLAGEFITFLREMDMDSELATGHDLAALQMYLASADRVRNTVQQIWESARPIWRPVCIQTDVPLEVSTAYGCVWKYRYLVRSDLRSCYMAAGFRFPTIGSHPSYADASGEPYVFVELGSDNDGSPVDTLQLSTEWSVSADLRLAKLPLRSLPIDPELFLSESSAWVSRRIAEAAALIS